MVHPTKEEIIACQGHHEECPVEGLFGNTKPVIGECKVEGCHLH